MGINCQSLVLAVVTKMTKIPLQFIRIATDILGIKVKISCNHFHHKETMAESLRYGSISFS